MVFVPVAHQISADEITTVGRDTYLTGTRIHDVSREAVLGNTAASGVSGATSADRDAVTWLVREQYLRTLAPVEAGGRVALLTSLEDAGPSAVRVCVRVIDNRGVAVAAGFQTIGCLTLTGDEAPLPSAIRDRRRTHEEPTAADGAASFGVRAVVGGASVASLFPDDILARGARVATHGDDAPFDDAIFSAAAPAGGAGRRTIRSSVVFRASTTMPPSIAAIDLPSGQSRTTGAPRRSSILGAIPEFAAPVIAGKSGGVAFVFPGADGYDGQLLRDLYAALPYLARHVDDADVVARRHFRSSFFRLVDADSLAEHDEHLKRCPELAQLGVLVIGVLFAEALQERGIRPDVVVGHGLGEVSALAVAGAFDVDTGLQIIAQRVLALRSLSGASGTTLPLAATNQLERSLSRLKVRSPRMQVYSPIAGGLQAPNEQLPRLLALPPDREPDFTAAVRVLRGAGCEYFVECGAGGLTHNIREILSGKPTDPTARTRRTDLGSKLAAASSVLAQRPASVDGTTATTRDGVTPKRPRVEPRASACPVAITGIGCTLPGARDLDGYWRNVLAGESAISTSERFGTEAWDGAAVLEGEGIASASVGEIEHEIGLPFTSEEFGRLTDTQRLLASALRQCLPRFRGATRAASARRVRCILGASAEGMREYEERSLIDRVRERLAGLDEPESLRNAIAAGFDEAAQNSSAIENTANPSTGLGAVVDRFVGGSTDVVLVDAACASSLYAIDLGMQSLRTMETDLVIVGGVFAPGASWQPLYGLFEGLVGSGSFPFEQRADGVVFGEGAVILLLTRLSDALSAGDRIHAVIRGVGLSCDGTKASVGEPSAAGQTLALRRAYENAGVELASVQFVEGHGLSDPASDAAEVDALRTVFAGTESTLSPRPLESVKALVGHTVWAAGAASVVKVCRALEEHVVPPQPHVAAPNPAAPLEQSGFRLPVSARAWPPNADGEPRRAGVSAFGLGGTNAHAVVEALSFAYHQRLADSAPADLPRVPLAVVGVAGLFASDNESIVMDRPAASPGVFHRAALRSTLPVELRPEVVDQLDVSQLLSVAGIEKALSQLANWRECRERTGVVAGMIGRTARATAATERVYRDDLRRVFMNQYGDFGIEREDAERIARTLHEVIGASTPPVTPHTLMGLLPNVAAGRAGSLFDLHGPNLVIDAGGRTIFEVLCAAERWLACGAADLMLAPMLRLDPRRPDEGEGALVLSLTTPACARERGWTILGELTIGTRDADSLVVQPARAGGTPVEVNVRSSPSLAGLDELAHALDGVTRGGATLMRWEREERASAAPPRRMTVPVHRGSVDPDWS